MADKARAVYLLELSYEEWRKKECLLTFPTQFSDYEYSVQEGVLSAEKFEGWIVDAWLNVKEAAIKELRDHV